MAEQHPGPAQPPRLRAVPGGTVPPGSAAPAPGTSAALVPPASAAPLTVADRAGTAARVASRAAANAARELWLHPDRFLHSFAHPEPETMKEHWAHVQSRAWVPEELTGTPEKVVAAAGVFHHLFVAYPLKAAAKGAKFAAEKVDEVADRPLRLYGLLVFLAVLFVLLVL